MIVVDASAVIDLLVPEAPDAGLERRLREGSDLHAPHLLDVEVTQALRRMTLRGSLGADRAADTRTDAIAMPIVRYPHAPLLERAWELRHTLSTYDAVYVALAELLDAPLVTCDAALARAEGIRATIELFDVRA